MAAVLKIQMPAGIWSYLSSAAVDAEQLARGSDHKRAEHLFQAIVKDGDQWVSRSLRGDDRADGQVVTVGLIVWQWTRLHEHVIKSRPVDVDVWVGDPALEVFEAFGIRQPARRSQRSSAPSAPVAASPRSRRSISVEMPTRAWTAMDWEAAGQARQAAEDLDPRRVARFDAIMRAGERAARGPDGAWLPDDQLVKITLTEPQWTVLFDH